MEYINRLVHAAIPLPARYPYPPDTTCRCLCCYELLTVGCCESADVRCGAWCCLRGAVGGVGSPDALSVVGGDRKGGSLTR
eukprot:745436-Rhodomonas_salina.3